MNRLWTFAALIILVSSCSLAQQYKVLYSLGAVSGDGAGPLAGLVQDSAGNLYGTTYSGGAYLDGTVFELSPNGTGGWTETVLYSFCADYSNFVCLDGSKPGAALIIDSMGNLYGTTESGGSTNGGGSAGVAFELSPPSQQGGAWKETVLYKFCSNNVNNLCLDGYRSLASLVFDKSGNLYGTTVEGGAEDDGTAFELSPHQSGWIETVLYNFCSNLQGSNCKDGIYPESSLFFDAAGNLYGTATQDGLHSGDYGVLFKLSPGASGWTETVLANFTQPGGLFPSTSPTMDAQGNLDGPLSMGGAHSDGALYQWNHTTGKLLEVSFNGSNGQDPAGAVLIDTLGRGYYGTTLQGGNTGTGGTAGVIYRVSLKGALSTLYKFCSQPNCTDGQSPYGNLVEDTQGNLYGTTNGGGANGAGVVYEITP